MVGQVGYCGFGRIYVTDKTVTFQKDKGKIVFMSLRSATTIKSEGGREGDTFSIYDEHGKRYRFGSEKFDSPLVMRLQAAITGFPAVYNELKQLQTRQREAALTANAPALPEQLAQPAASRQPVQTTQPAQTTQAQNAPLTNKDVVAAARAQGSPETIIQKLKASSTQFDTSPAALTQIRAAGVPDSVIVEMVLGSNLKAAPAPQPKTTAIAPAPQSVAGGSATPNPAGKPYGGAQGAAVSEVAGGAIFGGKLFKTGDGYPVMHFPYSSNYSATEDSIFLVQFKGEPAFLVHTLIRGKTGGLGYFLIFKNKAVLSTRDRSRPDVEVTLDQLSLKHYKSNAWRGGAETQVNLQAASDKITAVLAGADRAMTESRTLSPRQPGSTT